MAEEDVTAEQLQAELKKRGKKVTGLRKSDLVELYEQVLQEEKEQEEQDQVEDTIDFSVAGIEQEVHVDTGSVTLPEVEAPGERHAITKELPAACVFIVSLSPETSEESLRTFMENTYGPVMRCTTKTEKSNRPFAWVQFYRAEDADKAVSDSGSLLLDGVKLLVEKAKVNTTLFVGRIPKTMATETLHSIVSAFGSIEEVRLSAEGNPNESKGFGFVKFVYREDAKAAIDGLKSAHPDWTVEWAKNPKKEQTKPIDALSVFVGGIDHMKISEDMLRAKFAAYGELTRCQLIVPSQKRNPEDHYAFAFLKYMDERSASSAIQHENGAEWYGCKLRVQYPESQEAKEEKRRREQVKVPLPPYPPHPYPPASGGYYSAPYSYPYPYPYSYPPPYPYPYPSSSYPSYPPPHPLSSPPIHSPPPYDHAQVCNPC